MKDRTKNHRFPFAGLLLAACLAAAVLPVSLQAAEWTADQAIAELKDALAIPEGADLRTNPQAARERRQKIQAWWDKYQSTGIDLGENAYLSAAPRYFLGGSEGRAEATKQARLHIARHGGVTEHAGHPSLRGFFGARIFPMAAGEFLRANDFENLPAAIFIAADHSDNPYSIYAHFGNELVQSDAPRSEAVFHQLVGRVMTDERLDTAARRNFMTFMHGEPGARSDGAAAGRPRIPFVSFSGPDLEGNIVSVSDFEGQVLLVDFWATWCAPCLTEMPHVAAAHEKYKDRGFAVLGVSLDRANARDRIRQVMKEHNMDWPQIYDGKGWQAEAAVMNNISAIPATILLDRSGTPRHANLRGAELSRRVAELLAEEPETVRRPASETPPRPASRAIPPGRSGDGW